MGFRVRKSFGPKGFKINVGKKGISSASLKIAPGLTINSKRGTTVGIPGTGISYNSGGRKRKRATTNTTRNNTRIATNNASERNLKLEKQMEYNKKFKEFTGGYNKKAIIAIIVSFLLCVTPLWPLGLLLSLPSLIWILIDTVIKTTKFNKHLKESRTASMVNLEHHTIESIEREIIKSQMKARKER